MTNEKTSKKVSAIAGRVLAVLDVAEQKGARFIYVGCDYLGSVKQVKALAASCLTQSPDKKKAKR